MRITLNIKKSLNETANDYFEKAKKMKRKSENARIIIDKFKKQLSELDNKQLLLESREDAKEEARALEWFEKFRWFRSSEGFLCIGGRDATSNEVVIKKHTDKNDVVFHTEAPGSPFFVIKTEGKKPGDATIHETAIATASFSKAWKMGITVTEVFWVTPDQVSKQAPSGEYMPKGAFMIRGKRNFIQATLGLAVGKLKDGKVMAGPIEAVEKNCASFIKIEIGKDKPSDVAKKIAKKINAHVDDVMRSLPAGGLSLA
jgi:predicted ribosome quality control (RQC) complex YloA/Tae2 family protein